MGHLSVERWTFRPSNSGTSWDSPTGAGAEAGVVPKRLASNKRGDTKHKASTGGSRSPGARVACRKSVGVGRRSGELFSEVPASLSFFFPSFAT